MCSQSDDPTTYDAPRKSTPRSYVLSGDRPAVEPKLSIALAVVGDMLTAFEEAEATAPNDDDRTTARVALIVLRAARDRIAAAEARA